MEKKVSIKDIAKMVGVSPSLVSMVLNEKPTSTELEKRLHDG
ncbi:MAG: LacI family DNA-binding transcriptional regulator [Porphyromonadaceae bacterium]|nr:LacI family DNA-binding transcriptional regulator [Porphyromonadaceae bacterium]